MKTTWMNRKRLKQVDMLTRVLGVCCFLFFVCYWLFLKVPDHVFMSVFSFFTAVLILRLFLSFAEPFPNRDDDGNK